MPHGNRINYAVITEVLLQIIKFPEHHLYDSINTAVIFYIQSRGEESSVPPRGSNFI